MLGKGFNERIKVLRCFPSIQKYSDETPPSVLPTPSPPTRKPPLKRNGPNDPEQDELRKFLEFDRINKFDELDETHAPVGFLFKRRPEYVVYYELTCEDDDMGIPKVGTAIRIDQKLHVKLFYEGSPVPQPEWFRKKNKTDSTLTSRGMLVNFVAYIT